MTEEYLKILTPQNIKQGLSMLSDVAEIFGFWLWACVATKYGLPLIASWSKSIGTKSGEESNEKN